MIKGEKPTPTLPKGGEHGEGIFEDFCPDANIME
jgi:hypothetical protein